MRVLVVGATDEAIDIIRELLKRDHEVIVLDDNKSRIDRIVQEFDVATYTFSLYDLSAFEQAGMHRADIVLALHPNDIVNVLVCVYAKHFNVPKILAVVNSEQTLRVIERLGLSHGVVLKSRSVSRSIMEILYGVKLLDLDPEHYLVVTSITEGSSIEGRTVEDLEADGAKVLTIIDANGSIVNFDRSYTLKRGENVLIIVEKNRFEKALFKH